MNAKKIRRIRKLYGISASMMSDLLGFGTNQWWLYEKGAEPSESNGTLIWLAQNPYYFRKILSNVPQFKIHKMGNRYVRCIRTCEGIIAGIEKKVQKYKEREIQNLIKNV